MARMVYCDSFLLVLDKAPGEAVQGKHSGQKKLLTDWREFLDEPKLQPVHRIDQPVPGLVMFARGPEVFRDMHAQFTEGTVEREYLAVVSAPPKPPSGTLRDAIVVDSEKNISRIRSSGAESTLKYETIGHTDHHTVVRVRLVTGRHHQIRAQLAHHGWPVVGDTKYGARRPLRGGGIALLALLLRFRHPEVPLSITCRAGFPEGAMWRRVREVASESQSGASASD